MCFNCIRRASGKETRPTKMARSGELPETGFSGDVQSTLEFRNITPREHFDIEDIPGRHTANGFSEQRRTSRWSRLYRMALRKTNPRPSISHQTDEDEELLNGDTSEYMFGEEKERGTAKRRCTLGFWKLTALSWYVTTWRCLLDIY